MTPNSNKSSNEDIIQEWRDYEGNVAKAMKESKNREGSV